MSKDSVLKLDEKDRILLALFVQGISLKAIHSIDGLQEHAALKEGAMGYVEVRGIRINIKAKNPHKFP